MGRTIIIGAGAAGLCTGSLLLGKAPDSEVIILEKSNRIGGLSACWSRGGYTFEGGMHWLAGSSPSMQPSHDNWEKAGAFNGNNPAILFDPIVTLHHGSRKIDLHRNLDEMQEALTEASPEDCKHIKRLCHDIQLVRLALSAANGFKPSMLLYVIPALARIIRLWSISAGRYASRFNDPDLSELIRTIVCEEHNALCLIYTLTAWASGDGAYTVGGSAKLMQNIAGTFISRGGVIRTCAEVEKVIIKENKACGVSIKGGEILEADNIVVTSDAKIAIDNLFETPLRSSWADSLRYKMKPLAAMFIGLGVKADLSSLSYSLRIVPEQTFNAGGIKYDSLMVYNYAGVPGNAPEGCTALSVILYGDTYDYWSAALADGTYEEKKEMVVQEVIEVLSREIPQIAGKVEITTMATPLTHKRYTGAYKGSWMSIWQPKALPPFAAGRFKGSEGPSGLYFAGQRTLFCGGLPIALNSAAAAASAICKDRAV